MSKKILIFTFVFLFCGAVAANAQTAPAYKISSIKIVPFDSQTGKFQDEIKLKDERSFFNDLAISLFVVVEISGEAGSFADERKIQVTVSEGKRLKMKKVDQIGLIGEGGKYYFPVWLDPAMCSDVTVKAEIIGQKTASTMTRKIPFLCGE